MSPRRGLIWTPTGSISSRKKKKKICMDMHAIMRGEGTESRRAVSDAEKKDSGSTQFRPNQSQTSTISAVRPKLRIGERNEKK